MPIGLDNNMPTLLIDTGRLIHVLRLSVVFFLQDLSSWKTRRQSHRKSDEADRPESTWKTPPGNEATQQLSDEIEDMVLSAFGFTRTTAAQNLKPNAPGATVRSSDLVPADVPPSNTRQTHLHITPPLDTNVSPIL